MTLSEKQAKFSLMLAQLIIYINSQGYQVTLGRGYASEAANAADGGHKKSLHMKRLAQDLNLFKDGVFLTETKDHEPFGLYWEFLGGSWGGRFNDGNHYSCEWQGMK
jgi:hypothetical protein